MIVHLLHGVVIHASKLLFWAVEIFNFHLKLAHFAHHVAFFLLRPTTTYFVGGFYGSLFIGEEKQSEKNAERMK